MNTLAFAIIGHMVGDYLLQSDYLAENKKKSSFVCAIHCLIWTLSVMTLAGWWRWWVFPALFIPHFAQDRTGFVLWYMRTSGAKRFAEPPLAPWSLIVVDNTFHLLTLAVVARFLV